MRFQGERFQREKLSDLGGGNGKRKQRIKPVEKENFRMLAVEVERNSVWECWVGKGMFPMLAVEVEESSVIFGSERGCSQC